MSCADHDTDAGGSEDAPPRLRICRTCRHMRMRPSPALFSAAELGSAEVLAQTLKVGQERRERAEAEQRRFMAGEAFDYEPYNYEWCAHHTDLDTVRRAGSGDEELLTRLLDAGRVTLNPVSGDVTAVYTLCARQNPRGRCEEYEHAPA